MITEQFFFQCANDLYIYFYISHYCIIMLEKSARIIILCDLTKIAYLHIVCDFNLCDESEG